MAKSGALMVEAFERYWRERRGLMLFSLGLGVVAAVDIAGWYFMAGHPERQWLEGPLTALTFAFLVGGLLTVPLSWYYTYKSFQKRFEIIPSPEPAAWDDKFPKSPPDGR